MRDVRPERTHWRDAALSERHRLWGFNCPAVDIDLLLVEFCFGLPCALVEYKKHTCEPYNTEHATYKALAALANGYRHRPLPCLIATYNPADWSCVVTPLNDAAAKVYTHCDGERLSEQRFVTSLMLMRNPCLSADDRAVIDKLNTTTWEPRQ